jgi:hypothetical protein
MGKKRLDTTLEAEGAEFLVLGQLLIIGIPAYKAYMRNAGHDLVAVNPAANKAARLEVKSRWASDAHWNMGMKDYGSTDFYVYARLNRGNRYRQSPTDYAQPKFYVFPTAVVDELPKTGWGQARLNKLSDLERYEDRWDLVREFLGMGEPQDT